MGRGLGQPDGGLAGRVGRVGVELVGVGVLVVMVVVLVERWGKVLGMVLGVLVVGQRLGMGVWFGVTGGLLQGRGEEQRKAG